MYVMEKLRFIYVPIDIVCILISLFFYQLLYNTDSANKTNMNLIYNSTFHSNSFSFSLPLFYHHSWDPGLIDPLKQFVYM